MNDRSCRDIHDQRNRRHNRPTGDDIVIADYLLHGATLVIMIAAQVAFLVGAGEALNKIFFGGK